MYENCHELAAIIATEQQRSVALWPNAQNCRIFQQPDSLRLTDTGFEFYKSIAKFQSLPCASLLKIGEIMILTRLMSAPYYLHMKSGRHVIHALDMDFAMFFNLCGSNPRMLALT